MTFPGSAYNFQLTETAAGTQYNIGITHDPLPTGAILAIFQYRLAGTITWISGATGSAHGPVMCNVPLANNEYQVIVLFSNILTPPETITFTVTAHDIENFFYIPFINPVKFFDVDRANLAKYYTKEFDNYMFGERLYYWQQRENYKQVWQTTDIIALQFESTFDPIIVKLIGKYNKTIIELPALVGLPNKFIPNTYSFEIAMSLAGLTTGCYRLQIEAGTGADKKILISDCQYISSTQLINTLCLEYWNSRFHEDVIFETLIKFQLRLPGSFGFLDPGRKDEMYRDQKYNPSILSSKTYRQWPVHFGDHHGLPDDIIDLLNRVWSCDNVFMDNKAYGIADGSKFEFIEVDRYPKRGVKLTVEEGVNRYSKAFAVNTDTTKKIMSSVIVEAKVFGDVSNQGSANTVPVFNIE